jgi:hypothetical protein
MYYGCHRSTTSRFSEPCHEPYIQEHEVFEQIRPFLKSLYVTPANLKKLEKALDSLSDDT